MQEAPSRPLLPLLPLLPSRPLLLLLPLLPSRPLLLLLPLSLLPLSLLPLMLLLLLPLLPFAARVDWDPSKGTMVPRCQWRRRQRQQRGCTRLLAGQTPVECGTGGDRAAWLKLRGGVAAHGRGIHRQRCRASTHSVFQCGGRLKAFRLAPPHCWVTREPHRPQGGQLERKQLGYALATVPYNRAQLRRHHHHRRLLFCAQWVEHTVRG